MNYYYTRYYLHECLNEKEVRLTNSDTGFSLQKYVRKKGQERESEFTNLSGSYDSSWGRLKPLSQEKDLRRTLNFRNFYSRQYDFNNSTSVGRSSNTT